MADNVKHPGRPPVLSRELILAAGAAIPMEQFSVRAVAERLSVSPQSIYYYFKSKKALLAAIGEREMAQLPEIDPQDWRAYVRETLITYRNLLLDAESPTAMARFGGGWSNMEGPPSEAFVTRIEAFVGVLGRCGFTTIEAIEIFLLGSTLVTRSLVGQFSQEEAETQHRGLVELLEELGSDRFPNLAHGLTDLETPSIDAIFERHVEVMIEGIAAVYGR